MGNADIGVRLKQAREAAGLKQKEVCEELNIPKTQTISSYERGVNNPPVEMLGALAKLYGVSTDWLIFGENINENRDKGRTEFILELLEIADRLSLPLEAETYSNGDPKGYVMRLKNGCIRDFDSLIPDIYMLRTVKGIIGEDDYNLLIHKRVAEWAARSNNFEDQEYKDPCYLPIQDYTNLPF